MATFSFKPGASDPLALEPMDDNGGAVDLSGSALQIRVSDGANCIVLPGVLVAEGDHFEVDLNSLTLPPRLYRASVYMDWGDGWVREDEINLLIEGGC